LYRECTHQCPLSDAQERHEHIEATIPTIGHVGSDRDTHFLGVLEVFGFDDGDGRTYDWKRVSGSEKVKGRQEEVARHRKTGRLHAVYLPALLFGPSAKSGLSGSQLRLLMALTRELNGPSHA
jgi:hypothetical protein